MITVRPAESRGTTSIDWLYSRHTFSFGRYHDAEQMGFSHLRVINDDVIQPGGGFGEHPHRDMEIMTWVLEGSLRHGDSLGNLQELRPGELQMMTAGRGIRHSEVNGSETEPVHLLQIWIEPRKAGREPRYQQTAFPAEGRKNRWQLLAVDDQETDRLEAPTMPIAQAARVSVADLDEGESLGYAFDGGRVGWLHVARGEVMVAGKALRSGDAVGITDESLIEVSATGASQVLLFDLGA